MVDISSSAFASAPRGSALRSRLACVLESRHVLDVGMYWLKYSHNERTLPASFAPTREAAVEATADSVVAALRAWVPLLEECDAGLLAWADERADARATLPEWWMNQWARALRSFHVDESTSQTLRSLRTNRDLQLLRWRWRIVATLVEAGEAALVDALIACARDLVELEALRASTEHRSVDPTLLCPIVLEERVAFDAHFLGLESAAISPFGSRVDVEEFRVAIERSIQGLRRQQ